MLGSGPGLDADFSGSSRDFALDPKNPGGKMIRVILEPPLAARDGRSFDDHIDYARRCVRDCVLRGEAPIASHLLFTQPGILKDEIPDERALGIEAGLAWAPAADCSVFYTGCGGSAG